MDIWALIISSLIYLRNLMDKFRSKFAYLTLKMLILWNTETFFQITELHLFGQLQKYWVKWRRWVRWLPKWTLTASAWYFGNFGINLFHLITISSKHKNTLLMADIVPKSYMGHKIWMMNRSKKKRKKTLLWLSKRHQPIQLLCQIKMSISNKHSVINSFLTWLVSAGLNLQMTAQIS